MLRKPKQSSSNENDRQAHSASSGETLLSLLKKARLHAGLSQSELAGRLQTTPAVVRRLENGRGAVATLVKAMDAVALRVTGLPEGRSIGKRLIAARSRRNLDAATLAERAGIDESVVAALEAEQGDVADLLRVLAILAPKISRRAPERAYWGQGAKESRDSRFTPASFMTNVYAAFGEVDLDPCAHPLSPVIARRKIILGEGGDGLHDEWTGSLAFVNPPYSELLKWIRRAHEQWQAGKVKTVVCLVPVRTDSAFFHDTLSRDADLFLLKGRVKFLNPDGKDQPTPFSLMLVALGASVNQRNRFAQLAAGFWISRRRR